MDRFVHAPVAGPVEVGGVLPLAEEAGDGRSAVQGSEVSVRRDAVDVADLTDDPGGDELADTDQLDESGAELADKPANLTLDLFALGVDLADPS